MENIAKRTLLHTTESGIECWKDDVTGEIKHSVNPVTHKIVSIKQAEEYKKLLAKEQAIQNGRSKKIGSPVIMTQ